MRRLLSACSLIGVFALASPACTPSPGAPPKGDAEQASAPKAAQGTFDTTWLMAIARDPAPVNALLASNPEQGWQLLYQQKYAEAVSAFSADAAPADAVGRARAELAMADLYDRAHRLTLEVLSKMEERLAENADRIELVIFEDPEAAEPAPAPLPSAGVPGQAGARGLHEVPSAGPTGGDGLACPAL